MHPPVSLQLWFFPGVGPKRITWVLLCCTCPIMRLRPFSFDLCSGGTLHALATGLHYLQIPFLSPRNGSPSPHPHKRRRFLQPESVQILIGTRRPGSAANAAAAHERRGADGGTGGAFEGESSSSLYSKPAFYIPNQHFIFQTSILYSKPAFYIPNQHFIFQTSILLLSNFCRTRFRRN